MVNGKGEEHKSEHKTNRILAPLVTELYSSHSDQNFDFISNLLKSIVSSRKLPEEGLEDASIRHLLHHFSLMDSNNFPQRASVGEREGRVYSSIVRERHFYLSHGIGRSGDISALQPKAAGSSALSKLANILVLSVLKMLIRNIKASIILPVSTGMALTLSLLATNASFSDNLPQRKYVIWPRIDQKTCFKAILTAGFTPIVIENLRVGDELKTDLEGIRKAVTDHGSESILCVVSTTSCFAPRAPEDVVGVSRIAKDFGIPHIVNNAFGIQCSKTRNEISTALGTGRVDAVIMSTDKNFLVPVGGSIVATGEKAFIENLSQIYPGRASISPVVDIAITLLSMGFKKLRQLHDLRNKNFERLSQTLAEIAGAQGERLLKTPSNRISMAITLSTLPENRSPQSFGAMLFNSFCFGHRAVPRNAEKTICGRKFVGYGSHSDDYGLSYLTCAVAIGSVETDIERFALRLKKAFFKIKKGGR